MSKKFLLAAALGILSLTNNVNVHAEPSTTVANSVMLPTAQSTAFNAVKAKLTKTLGLSIASIKPSPMVGLIEVVTDQGLFYA